MIIDGRKPLIGIFYNADAGSGVAFTQANTVKARLKDAGNNSELITSDNRQNALSMLKKRIQDFQQLIIIGGDGTINVVLTAMVQINHFIPIGLVPSGKHNYFARRWHISLDVETACQTIITGIPKAISFLMINDNFAAHSSVRLGVDPRQMLADVEEVGQFKIYRKLSRQIKYFSNNLPLKVNYQIGEMQRNLQARWLEIDAYDENHEQKYRDIPIEKFTLKIMQGWWADLFFIISGNVKTKNEDIDSQLLVIKQLKPDVKCSFDGEVGILAPLQIQLINNKLKLLIPQGNRL